MSKGAPQATAQRHDHCELWWWHEVPDEVASYRTTLPFSVAFNTEGNEATSSTAYAVPLPLKGKALRGGDGGGSGEHSSPLRDETRNDVVASNNNHTKCRGDL